MADQYTIPGLNSVNIGLTPNDGTGNSLRDAFKITNQNVYELSRFLLLAPELPQVTVIGPVIADSVTSNVSTTVQSTVTSTIDSTSVSSGAFTVVGGVGIAQTLNVGGNVSVNQNVFVTKDIHVEGTLYGDVEATTLTANTLGVTGDAILGANVVINGTLTVFGNVSTVTTSEYIIQHPVIELGAANTLQGNTATLSYNDGKDRGISFYWYEDATTSQQMGFMGFENSTKKFTFIPHAAYTSVDGTDNEVFAGAAGDAVFNTVEADIISTGVSQFNSLNAIAINVYGGGITGTLQTNAQPNINSVGTLNGLTVVGSTSFTGNTSMAGNLAVNTGSIYVTGGMLYINGDPVATASQAFHGGNIYLDSVFSSGTSSTDIYTGAAKVYGGLGVTGNVNVGGQIQAPTIIGTNITGTLTTAAQPNITTVGTLGNLLVSNAISGSTVSSLTMNVSDRIYADKLTVYNGITGTVLTAAQPNITSVGNLTSLAVVGNVSAANFNGAVTGSVTGNLTGNVTGTILTGTQPFVTSLGTLSALGVTGATTVGSLNAGSGVIQTTGNITSTSSVVGGTLYGTIKTASQPSITTVGNLTTLAVTGLSTLSAAVTLGSDLYATGAGTQSIGTGTNRFGTLFSTVINNSTSLTTGNVIASSGGVKIQTLGQGIVFPDGTVQTTAGAASGSGSVGYSNVAGIVTNQSNSATIQATTANIAGNIVLRDGSGSFNAGTITAAAFSGPLTGQVTGNVSGSSATVTGASQTAITSVGTLNGLTVSGAVTVNGDTTLNGNLYINGTTTTLNTTVMDIADVNITLAKNATTAAAANGAGLTVNGSGATIVYASLDDSWNLNKKVSASSFYGSGVGLTGIPNSALSNSTINVIAGTGLSGGANVQLGGSATISLPAVGTAVSNQFVKITTDTQGRVSATTSVSAGDITTLIGGSAVTNATNISIGDDNATTTPVYPTWSSTTTGNTAAKVSSSRLSFVPSTGVLTASGFIGPISGNVTGTIQTASQPNITTVGTLGSLAVTGNVSAANFNGPATGLSTNRTNWNTLGAKTAVVGQLGWTNYGNNYTIFDASSGLSPSGTTIDKSNSTGGWAANYPTLMGWDGSLTYGVRVDSAKLADGIANQKNSATITASVNNDINTIVLRDGSGNFYSNIIYATANAANYADLAEKYQSDADYAPGTVLVFGGPREVTTTGHHADVSVAGVVSTAPAYLMNMQEPNSVAVALRGKVPVKVMGPVKKGDLLVTSYVAGFAESVGKDPRFGIAVFAKSLEEDLNTGEKVINAVII
jgi:hypothetical protein